MATETKNTKTFYNTEIPSDWNLKKLKDILIEGRLGGNYENAEANNGIPVIKMGNLDRGTIKIDKVQYLPKNENFNDEDILVKDDLLFNTRNTLELVGKVAIWNNELPLAVYNSNLMKMKYDTSLVESNWFMNYAFNSNYGLRQLRAIATGTTSVAAIYGRDLESIKFPLPPLPEQKAIAQVLSTADAAIHTTEKLIAQKELRKKWLMQQLLSEKRIVKNEKWGKSGVKEVLLKDIAQVTMGQSPNSEDYNTEAKGLPLIQGNADLTDRKQVVRYWTSQSNKECDAGDLIMTVRAPVGAIGLATQKSSIGRGVCSIKPKNIDYWYLYHLLVYKEEQWKKLEQGSTFTAVGSKDIFHFPLFIVHSLEEQTAIAQVLQAADKEISLLKAKAEKLREQKKGLMQVLLTGKVRLKIDNE